MSFIQRYKERPGHPSPGGGLKRDRNGNRGDWVRYEDHKSALEANDEKWRRRIETKAKSYDRDGKYVGNAFACKAIRELLEEDKRGKPLSEILGIIEDENVPLGEVYFVSKEGDGE